MQINRLTSVNGKITDAASARSAVVSRKWIVGSINSSGLFSIAAMPVTHYSGASALAECERLAKLNPGTTYISLQLQGGKVVPSTVVAQTL